MRAAYHAQMLPGITDAFLLAQRGFFDIGFIGGAQIDRYGNLNTSAIGGSYERPRSAARQRRRQRHHLALPRGHHPHRARETALLGDGGFHHEPGWLDGGESRRKSGLLFGGVARVVTTLGVFGFEPESRRMRLEALHPGVSVDTVRASTGFEVLVSDRLTTTKRLPMRSLVSCACSIRHGSFCRPPSPYPLP